jgi:hypothetical protein
MSFRTLRLEIPPATTPSPELILGGRLTLLALTIEAERFAAALSLRPHARVHRVDSRIVTCGRGCVARSRRSPRLRRLAIASPVEELRAGDGAPLTLVVMLTQSRWRYALVALPDGGAFDPLGMSG